MVTSGRVVIVVTVALDVVGVGQSPGGIGPAFTENGKFEIYWPIKN